MSSNREFYLATQLTSQVPPPPVSLPHVNERKKKKQPRPLFDFDRPWMFGGNIYHFIRYSAYTLGEVAQVLGVCSETASRKFENGKLGRIIPVGRQDVRRRFNIPFATLLNHDAEKPKPRKRGR